MTPDQIDLRHLDAGLVMAFLEHLAASAPLDKTLTSLLELAVSACKADSGHVRVDAADDLGSAPVEVSVLDSLRGSGALFERTIEVEGQVIGEMRVLVTDQTVPDTEVHTVLDVAARAIGVAWFQARALEREREGRQQEQGLIRAGQALALTIRLGDVLPVILEELRRVVPYDTASVQELRGDQVVIVGGAGINLAVFFGVGFDVERPGAPNADVVRRREPVIVGDILADHPYWNFPLPEHEMTGVRCWMGVPLVFGDECVGMLTLDKYEPDFYTERHARLAQSFATQAAIAIENARAFERAQHEVEVRRQAEERLREANEALQQRMAEIEALQEHLRDQSVRDPLTGVFNRRYLMETLERELPRARRAGQPLTVAVVDVDHFKSINDLLGHEAGDQVLAQVAGVLASHIRDEDVVCRYGGEEFVLVLPGTEIEVARTRADAWRDELRAMGLPDALSDRPITISVGLAAAPQHGSTGEALVRVADAAMYVAKDLGRDRVELASS